MKTINIYILIAVVSVGLLFQGCENLPQGIRGTGDVITEEYEVSNFYRIDLDGSGDVIFEQSDEVYVRVTTNENLVPVLAIGVLNNTLHLRPKKNVSILSYDKLTYTIGCPDIEGFSIDGSGSFSWDNNIDSDIFEISIDGSGDINGNILNADEIYISIDGSGRIDIDEILTDFSRIDIDGSGNVQLGGQSTDIEVDIDGSGDVKCFNVESLNAFCDIDGGGDIRVNVENILHVSIDGSGRVLYKGSPSVTSNIDGSGDVVNSN